MPSPFPGMNPYLEQDDVWHVFHEQFCNHCFEALVPQVRPSYIVKIDQHMYIREPAAEERQLVGRGDVTVASARRPRRPVPRSRRDLQPPGRVPVIDIERESFIEIRDRQSRQLVTVIVPKRSE